MVNPEIANEISKLKCLHIHHTLSYEAIIQSRNEAELEYLVKKQVSTQLAEFIATNVQINTRDTHHGRSYEIEAYFFTRTELLQLAEQCYNKGFNRSKDLHQNFTSSVS